MLVFVVALFTRDEPRDGSKSIHKSVKTMQLHTMEFYSTINKNRVMESG